MRRAGVLFTGLGTATAAIGLLVASASAAAPFGPRVPQVPFNGASLQAYLGGTIDVYADQVWTPSISGDTTFSVMLEMSTHTGANSIGAYNTAGPPSPPLFQIFPAAATAGWFATAHFGGGNLVVTLFDNNSILQGQSFYPGVDANAFGFYLQGPGGTFYSEDARIPAGIRRSSSFPAPGRTPVIGGCASKTPLTTRATGTSTTWCC